MQTDYRVRVSVVNDTIQSLYRASKYSTNFLQLFKETLKYAEPLPLVLWIAVIIGVVESFDAAHAITNHLLLFHVL